MVGNMNEWCRDWYSSSYYANSPSSDPRGISSGSRRVFRGGSWYGTAYITRTAFRGPGDPGLNDLGFRCVRSSVP
jgi:formylglycine-generating enzyme required for sulfatase activity